MAQQDEGFGNLLQTLIAQLSAQAGPRGATFAGKQIPQGQAPDLKALMMQSPMNIPEEGYGTMPNMNPSMMKYLASGMGGGMGDFIQALKRIILFENEGATQFEKQKQKQQE